MEGKTSSKRVTVSTPVGKSSSERARLPDTSPILPTAISREEEYLRQIEEQKIADPKLTTSN